MAFIFGAAAFIILAFILLLFPSRLSMKGKLLLIVLIMILSLVSYMANTFLPLWQTIGMIFLLTFLFTYLLSKRISVLYIETELYDFSEDRKEEKKHILPVRIIGSTVTNPVIQNPTFQLEIEEVIGVEEFTLSKEFNDSKTLDFEQATQNEEVLANTAILKEVTHKELDTDLDALLNRFAFEDDLEEIQDEVPFPDIVNRDLELLLGEIEEREFKVDIVESTYVEPFKGEDFNEHVIKEIELMPIKKPEESKEEQPFTPFELIEEIKEFKKEK